MAKKRLLIILGAGSSLDQGMPSVAAIDKKMQAWSAEWFHSDPAIPPVDNYFLELWRSAESYYARPFLSYQVHPNFERVLGDMVALAHWMAPAPMGNALRQMVTGDQPPRGLRFRFDDDAAPFGAVVMINHQLGYLLKRLAQHVRDCCKMFDSHNLRFAPYRKLIEALRGTFDVGIYNLNYDNMAVTAWPGAFTGFSDDGTFDARAVHNRPQWDFVYHLHGSVHHTLTDASVGSIRWQRDLSAAFRDGDEGQATNMVSDGKSFPRSTLIAGGFKLDQLLIEPFHSFYAVLNRHLHQADAVLIGGYGFTDTHVNRALRSCLEDNLVRNPSCRTPVMVLDKSCDGGWQMDTRQDVWSRQMQDTLLARMFRCEMLDMSAPNTPHGLIPGRSFEVSSTGRVAVWHGGFCEAAHQLDRIGAFLEGHDVDAIFRLS